MKTESKPIAVGYTADGTKKEFEIINGVLDCRDSILVSIDCGEATWIDCSYNQLTSLNAPLATMIHCQNNNFSPSIYFQNPKTGRGVLRQGELYYAGCFCQKTAEELKQKCLAEGFDEIIEHFNL